MRARGRRCLGCVRSSWDWVTEPRTLSPPLPCPHLEGRGPGSSLPAVLSPYLHHCHLLSSVPDPLGSHLWRKGLAQRLKSSTSARCKAPHDLGSPPSPVSTPGCMSPCREHSGVTSAWQVALGSAKLCLPSAPWCPGFLRRAGSLASNTSCSLLCSSSSLVFHVDLPTG